MERILDINVRSLYRRIYYQLNTTSISDKLQRYVDKMTSITTLPSNPQEHPKQSFFPSDSYAASFSSTRHGEIMIQKVDPNYDAYRRQKWPIKSCIGHIYVCVYGVGCRIVALKSWYLYFLPDTPVCRRPHVWFGDGNETLRNLLDSFTVHDP